MIAHSWLKFDKVAPFEQNLCLSSGLFEQFFLVKLLLTTKSRAVPCSCVALWVFLFVGWGFLFGECWLVGIFLFWFNLLLSIVSCSKVLEERIWTHLFLHWQ